MASKKIQTICGSEIPPQERIKLLSLEGSDIMVSSSVKCILYVRSGRELARSAKSYLEDGNIDTAFILYTRLLTLFLEKIISLPDYKNLGQPDKDFIRVQVKDTMVQAESLKVQLLEQFRREHEEYIANREIMKLRLKEEEEERRREEEERRKIEMQESEERARRAISNLKNQGHQINSSSRNFYIPPATAPAAPISSPYASLENSLKYNENGTGSRSIPNTPSFDRNSKPARMLSPMSTGLRQVIIPADLTIKFLRLSENNTLKNVETCGILTGKIMREKLVITHLIIPKQNGTPDSCTTLKEEEIFEVQEKNELITIGWIHTHPSQTAFLSSVDLHTHCSYQLMMPEAIAIVCAPSVDRTGIFLLNSNGIDYISQCTEPGFHPHNNAPDPIYLDASHTMIDDTRKVQIVDLRFII